MFVNLLTPKPLWEEINSRVQGFIQEDGLTEDIDEEITPLLLDLNKIPGLATVWSCAGHPEDKKSRWQNFYVICSVSTLEAAGRIFSITGKLIEYNTVVDSNKKGRKISPFKLNISHVYRQYTSEDRSYLYPAIIINYPVNVKNKKAVIEVLGKIIKDISEGK